MRRLAPIIPLLLALAVGSVAAPASAQDATPATVAFPLSPDASACTVEPRPLADFEPLLRATPPSGPAVAEASPTPFVVPEGEPTDAATVAGVTATLVERFACYHAGDPRRFHALYTDEGLRRAYPPGMVDQAFFDAFFAASPVPVDGAEARSTILAIEDVTLLADGRVGALLRSDEPEFGGRQVVSSVFAEVGDRYLVDVVVHGLPIDGAGATPAP